MKNFMIIISIFVISVLAGCNDDNFQTYPNTPPVLQLTTEELTIGLGASASIQGQVSDDFGVKFLTIFGGGLSINTQLDVSTRTQISDSYTLNYSFTVPPNTSAGEYTITVTAKNLTGQLSAKTIKVNIVP